MQREADMANFACDLLGENCPDDEISAKLAERLNPEQIARALMFGKMLYKRKKLHIRDINRGYARLIFMLGVAIIFLPFISLGIWAYPEDGYYDGKIATSIIAGAIVMMISIFVYANSTPKARPDI